MRPGSAMSAPKTAASTPAARLARRVAPPGARRAAPALAAGWLSAACSIGLLATSGWLITRSSQKPPVFVLSVAIGAVQAFALGRGVARYFERLAVHGLALDALGSLRVWLFDTLGALVPAGLRGFRSGDVLSAFVADTESVGEGLAKTATSALDVTGSVLLGGALAVLVAPGVGALLVGSAIALVGLAAVGSRLGRTGAERAGRARAELAGVVMETARAAPELAVYGREDLVSGALSRVRGHATRAALRQAAAYGAGRAAVAWAAGAGMVGVLVAGIAAVHAGRLSGIMLAVLAFVSMAVFDQCTSLPAALAGMRSANAAAARLEALSTLPPPAAEPATDRFPGCGPLGARLEGVDLEFGGGKQSRPVLVNASLGVEPGRRVAIVGPSGAGKSSTVNLLMHFLEPASGSATVGDVDVRERTREGLARNVGWLGDGNHLFAASVADNLRVVKPEASESECESTLRRVGLGRWYESLPDGLDTPLGAGGRGVSAGERQRLAMARALLAGGTVLLLDEPTAHVDPASAGSLLADLLAAAGKGSVLVVSHEPGIAAYVDEVVTLDQGGISRRSTAGE